MPSYKAPVDDTVFLLRDVFDYGRYGNLPRFAEAPLDLVETVLSEGGKFAQEVVQPLNRIGDQQGCARAADGSVTTPKGFKDAYRAYVEGGWVGVSGDAAYGGQGLPHFLGAALSEYLLAANLSFAMYPGLTTGAAAALATHGDETLKRRYLPKLTSGEWSGTMNLTEPQCGTDLGLIKTRAVRQSDGSFAITGQKIFISAGEHDLTDNIIHLVLARIEGAPAGTKGISMFLVPKHLVKDDGSLGNRNGVLCGSIEHKMGIHGNSTCVLDYDGAQGWLVGEENRGLNAMFVMMNGARLGVAIQGLALSEVAYQNAAAYAKERRQGRALGAGHTPGQPADPIIVHPDVRRMLLEVRAFNEAARALMLWVALSEDEALESSDPAAKLAAEDRIGLLTPVIKGVFTDHGLCQRGQGAAGAGRPRLHRRIGHGAVRPRCAHHHDLRGGERRAGARPGWAQAAQGRRARNHRLLRRGLRLPRRQQGRRRARPLSRPRQGGARTIAAGDDVADAKRDEEPRERRRGVERLHASLRPDRARLHVGAHRQGGAGAPGGGDERAGA